MRGVAAGPARQRWLSKIVPGREVVEVDDDEPAEPGARAIDDHADGELGFAGGRDARLVDSEADRVGHQPAATFDLNRKPVVGDVFRAAGVG